MTEPGDQQSVFPSFSSEGTLKIMLTATQPQTAIDNSRITHQQQHGCLLPTPAVKPLLKQRIAEVEDTPIMGMANPSHVQTRTTLDPYRRRAHPVNQIMAPPITEAPPPTVTQSPPKVIHN